MFATRHLGRMHEGTTLGTMPIQGRYDMQQSRSRGRYDRPDEAPPQVAESMIATSNGHTSLIDGVNGSEQASRTRPDREIRNRHHEIATCLCGAYGFSPNSPCTSSAWSGRGPNGVTRRTHHEQSQRSVRMCNRQTCLWHSRVTLMRVVILHGSGRCASL